MHTIERATSLQLKRELRAAKIVEYGGIPVPKTTQYLLGETIMRNRGLEKGMRSLLNIATDDDLMCAALAVLHSLEVSAKLRKENTRNRNQ